MGKVIKKVPIPMAGLMLGLAALGNLIQSYGDVYRNLSGGISAFILILILAKIIMYPNEFKKGLNNPVVGSVIPTLSMGIVILSTYIKPYFYLLAYTVWIVGLLLHVVLIIYFTKKYIFNFNIKNVFPSWFIVYVGIVVGSVTAPAYSQLTIGKYLFWFGLITYLMLLPIVLYRVFKIKSIPEPALPTIAIFAAPASLCLAGYINTFQNKNMFLLGFLVLLSLIMIGAVLIYMPKLLRLKFYPSYSAFTFPFVISGISIKLTNGFLISSGYSIKWLRLIVKFEELIAIVFVIYTLFKYIQFVFPKKDTVPVEA